MNSWEPSLQSRSSLDFRPVWFEALLPVPAAPLVVLLLFILPVFLLAAESLLAPVYEYVQSLLMPVNAGMSYTSLPILLLIKIILFSAFSFTGVTLLLLKISTLYTEVWSYYLKQPHPDHCPYHPHPQDSMVALFNWSLFRSYKVLGPPLAWTGITILAGTISMWIFNFFTDFSFLTFQLEFSLSFFAMATLGFLTMLQYFKSGWTGFSTILGDMAAMTEPEKPAQVIYDRTRKLAFLSPWSILLYPLYFVFYLALAVEMILLIGAFDITDLMWLNPSIITIFAFEFATLMVFLMLNGMKFLTYHDALGRFYNQPQKARSGSPFGR